MHFRDSVWNDSEPEYAPCSRKIRGKWHWIPPRKYVKAGYAIKTFRLPEPHEETPTPAQASQCRAMTRDLLNWWEGETNGKEPGTWAWLIGKYLTDEFSGIWDVAPGTRADYKKNLAPVEAAIGNVLLSDTNFERMMMWKKAMESKGRSRHYIKKWFTHLGLVISHGKKLGIEDCARIKSIREEMRISSPASRQEFLTRDQAERIIGAADAKGWHMLALSVMFRFEYLLRGVDVYGKWEPAEGRKGGIQHKNLIWGHGLTWEMFEPDLSAFTKVISKTARSLPTPYTWSVLPAIRKRLMQTPEEKRLGPVITMEDGLPPRSDRMTRQFKTIVRDLGLPESLRMADSRAGGITEAKALVDPYTLRDAAQHTQVTTTDRYVRARSDAANKVVEMRRKK